MLKKRVSLPGRGKRGATRTLVAFKRGDKAFFIYGFARNDRANISNKELHPLRLLAKDLLSFPASLFAKAIQAGELTEMKGE